MDKQIFKQIGFIDAEIEVYKSLLRKGPCLVSDLHKETGLHRTHIYDLMEKLREKGIISTFIQSGKKYFRAYSPSKVLDYIDNKKEAIRSILPELDELMKVSKEDTEVELFKGKEGLKTVLLDVLKTKKDYSVMANVKKFEEILEFSLPSFLRDVEKLKIKERVLSDKKENIIKIKTGNYRHLNCDYVFPTSFIVYGNKVVIIIWNLPYYAILIKNESVARTYRNYFDFFWKQARKCKNL